MALARMLMGGPAETRGTAFEPVTRQQQMQNWQALNQRDDAWRSAEGSPWKAPEPGMLAKFLMHPGTQSMMNAANFIGPPVGKGAIRAFHGGTTKNWRTGEPYTELNSANGPYSGFFSDKPEVANKFAAGFSRDNGVFPVDLHVKNPLVIDAKGRPAREFQFENSKLNWPKVPGATERDAQGFNSMFNWSKEFRDAVTNPNHDAVMIKNTADEGTIYIPTKRNTVKSATSGDWLYGLGALLAGGTVAGNER
jgi:hypothetical protein